MREKEILLGRYQGHNIILTTCGFICEDAPVVKPPRPYRWGIYANLEAALRFAKWRTDYNRSGGNPWRYYELGMTGGIRNIFLSEGRKNIE